MEIIRMKEERRFYIMNKASLEELSGITFAVALRETRSWSVNIGGRKRNNPVMVRLEFGAVRLTVGLTYLSKLR